MQHIRRKGDQGSARPFRDIGTGTGLQHQVATLIGGWIAQLQAEGDFARLDILAAQIDMPVVMATFLAVIDGILKGLDQAVQVEAIEPPGSGSAPSLPAAHRARRFGGCVPSRPRG